MSGQTHKHSILESVTNVVVGYGIAVLTQVVVFPMFDIHTKPSEHFKIALIFTCISLVRSYILRRIWNGMMLKNN